MKILKILMLVLLAFSTMVIIPSCGGGDDPNPSQQSDNTGDDNTGDDNTGNDNTSGDDNTGDNTANTNSYSGSATYGDLITFAINTDDQTYELYNETTDATEKGSYSIISEAEVDGLYHMSAGGDDFFGLELDDKIVVGNFPSGRSSNELTFGVTSEVDNSTYESQIPGDYIYIRLGEVSVNGSSDFKEYGVFTLHSDGSLNLLYFATGGTGDYVVYDIAELENEGLEFPIDDGYSDNTDFYLDGTWAIDGTKKDRLTVTLDGSAATGYAYAAGSTSVFLMDLGTGQGSAIAYKITATSASDVVGTYKFIDTHTDGSRGAGAYTINSDGTVDYAYTTDASTVETGSFGPLSFYDVLTNVMESEFDGDYITMVVAGDAIMHFITDENGKLISYGAGAKID